VLDIFFGVFVYHTVFFFDYQAFITKFYNKKIPPSGKI